MSVDDDDAARTQPADPQFLSLTNILTAILDRVRLAVITRVDRRFVRLRCRRRGLLTGAATLVGRDGSCRGRGDDERECGEQGGGELHD